MKTLSTIREIARQLLRDEFVEGTDEDFQDDELDIHINEVLVEISQKRPYEVKETVESDGTKELDVSGISDLLEVVKAEYPVGNDPPDYRNVSIFGNTIRLDIDTTPTSGDDVYLYCNKVHQLTDSASTLNPELESALVQGTVAKAGLAYLNKMRAQIVPATYQWYQGWANNQYMVYQNSLRGLTRSKVWEFYPRD
jgi:hypothetical protein